MHSKFLDAVGRCGSRPAVGRVHGEHRVFVEFHAVARPVELAVVGSAEQHHATDIGTAAIDPVVDVMYIAMFRFRVATRCPTMSVSCDDRSSLHRCGGANGAAHVQHRVAGHHDPLDHGVAGEQGDCSRVELGAVEGDAGAVVTKRIGEPGTFCCVPVMRFGHLLETRSGTHAGATQCRGSQLVDVDDE